MADPNVYGDEWDEGFPPRAGWESRWKRLVPRGRSLGMSLYELEPGQTQCPYHFHHGSDELVLVLSGSPTLRTPGGERTLTPGDVVHFPTGPDGAHRIHNEGSEPARYLIASSNVSPEVVEYPDSGKVAALSRSGPLATVHRLGDAVDYFDGEQARGERLQKPDI